MTRRLFALGSLLGLALLPVSAAEVPRKAPELAVQLVNGRQVLLSQYRGKVVLLEFLHTTCPHCQQSSAFLESLYKELGPRGFQPIGVAFNDNATMLVPDFVRQIGLTYPVGVSTRDTVVAYLQHSMMQPLYVPQMMFVDRKGVIRAQYGGEDPFFQNQEVNIRAQVEALLKEPAGSQKTRPSSSAKPRTAKKSQS